MTYGIRVYNRMWLSVEGFLTKDISRAEKFDEKTQADNFVIVWFPHLVGHTEAKEIYPEFPNGFSPPTQVAMRAA